jgi:hypothetical protein
MRALCLTTVHKERQHPREYESPRASSTCIGAGQYVILLIE